MPRLASRIAAIVVIFFSLTQFASAQDPAGFWRGNWSDTKSGHQGPMKATITKCDDTHYKATFTGRFFGVIPFRFHAILTVTGVDGDALILSGSSNLGLMFGTFTYNARVTENCFVADFCSAKYQGRFVMHRECPSKCGH